MKAFIKYFFSNHDQVQETADLVILAEEILNGKFHFLCSVNSSRLYPNHQNANMTEANFKTFLTAEL